MPADFSNWSEPAIRNGLRLRVSLLDETDAFCELRRRRSHA